MTWEKGGLIFAPKGGQPWARQYATLPTPFVVDADTIRVYYAALDDNRYGRIGYVDLDAHDPLRILDATPEPVLDIGEPGAFDDSGVNPSCLIRRGVQFYLYYIGWQRCERVPYMLFTGLAVSNDGRDFVKMSRVPILDRTPLEPFSRSAPFVLAEEGRLRMWYWSCLDWSMGQQGIHYNNAIRHAVSDDGASWYVTGDPLICIMPREPDEYAVGRPWVIHEQNIYKMWFSARSFSRRYHIGYAESRDGLEWTRMDERAGIAVSDTGWDSEMICYPAIVDAAGERYLFYNGNRHGSTGFGFARWRP